jgi:hypothetical protein
MEAIVRVIETTIDIAASADRIWDILIRFDDYPGWNPFVTSIAGAAHEGSGLLVRIQPPGRAGMTFKPIVMMARDYQLVWVGHLLLPGLFDGEHRFRIETHGGMCRFHQSERFSGILVPLFGAGLFAATQRGFEAMNVALKQRAEA